MMEGAAARTGAGPLVAALSPSGLRARLCAPVLAVALITAYNFFVSKASPEDIRSTP